MAKILIVDDEPDIRSLVQSVLEEAEHEVESANDGKHAVLSALEKTPDLVIMDINMPVVDGITALKLFRSLPPLHSIPVIMLTAFARKEEFAREAGCVDFIVKPFNPKGLRESVDSSLSSDASIPAPWIEYLDTDISGEFDSESITMHIKGSIDVNSADELLTLVKSLKPLYPLHFKFNIDAVDNIDTGFFLPFKAIRDVVIEAKNKMSVFGFDENKYPQRVVRMVKNIFKTSKS